MRKKRIPRQHRKPDYQKVENRVSEPPTTDLTALPMTLKKVYLSTMIAALGGLLFGFDTAVISGTTDALQKHFGLNEAMLGFTVATALLGTIFGSLMVSRPSDQHGRRKVLVVLINLKKLVKHMMYYLIPRRGSHMILKERVVLDFQDKMIYLHIFSIKVIEGMFIFQ